MHLPTPCISSISCHMHYIMHANHSCTCIVRMSMILARRVFLYGFYVCVCVYTHKITHGEDNRDIGMMMFLCWLMIALKLLCLDLMPGLDPSHQSHVITHVILGCVCISCEKLTGFWFDIRYRIHVFLNAYHPHCATWWILHMHETY